MNILKSYIQELRNVFNNFLLIENDEFDHPDNLKTGEEFPAINPIYAKHTDDYEEPIQSAYEKEKNDNWWENPEALSDFKHQAKQKIPLLSYLAHQGVNIFDPHSETFPFRNPALFYQYSPAHFGEKDKTNYATSLLTNRSTHPEVKKALLNFAKEAGRNPVLQKVHNITNQDLTQNIHKMHIKPQDKLDLPLHEKDAAAIYYNNLETLPSKYKFTVDKFRHEPTNDIYLQYQHTAPIGLEDVHPKAITGMLSGAHHADSISPFLLHSNLNNNQWKIASNRDDISPEDSPSDDNISWPSIVEKNKYITPEIFNNLLDRFGRITKTDPQSGKSFEGTNFDLTSKILKHPNTDVKTLDKGFELDPHSAFENHKLSPDRVHDYFKNHILKKDPIFIPDEDDDPFTASSKNKLYLDAFNHPNIGPKTIDLMIKKSTKDPQMLIHAAKQPKITEDQAIDLWHRLESIINNPEEDSDKQYLAKNALNRLIQNPTVDDKIANYVINHYKK